MMRASVDLGKHKLVGMRQPSLKACLLCEFFCTAFLMYVGLSFTAVDVLSNGSLGAFGNLAWGACLMMAIQIGNHISGSQMNPAISIMLYAFGEMDLQRLGLYMAAQFWGAFVGSAGVFLVYYDAIDKFDGGMRTVRGPNATAHIFATYPQDYLSVMGGLFDQMSTTALLVILIKAITHKTHGLPKAIHPYAIGTALTVLITAFSKNCGAALNPARDLGPRVFTFIAGYGWEVFSYNNYTWFWIPIVGPIIGVFMGAFLYEYFIGNADEIKNKVVSNDEENRAHSPPHMNITPPPIVEIEKPFSMPLPAHMKMTRRQTIDGGAYYNGHPTIME
uniref:Aquaporin-9 n=1 Tax=Panagrellus redivivus TaxID=6233 RepID=A0A7E4V8I7_PANRE